MDIADRPPPRLRLLVLTSTYPRWAGDHEPGFVHELSRRLQLDFDVTVLCPHAPGAATAEVLDGVRVLRYRYAPSALESLVNNGGILNNLRRAKWKWLLLPPFLAAQAWAIRRSARRLQPDVVHAHWLLPQGLLVTLLALAGVRLPPFVVTSHGSDLFALRGRLMDWLRRRVTRRAAQVTVVSEIMRERLLRDGAPAATIRVEPMGVDLGARFTADPSVPRSRDEILFVGRLVDIKGLQHLIDALPMILAAHPAAFLTVVGFGPDEPARRTQVGQLGLGDKVRFVGAVSQSELPNYYRRAAVFVAPFVIGKAGDQEGLGLVVIEAAGCGCPIVVSRLPSNTDLLVDFPEFSGVAPGDVAALAAAVLSQMRRGSLPVSPLLMKFDWSTRARSYASLLALTAADPAARAP